MKLHKDLIMELPEFIPESFCKHLIDKFEADSNKRKGVVNYGDGDFVDTSLKNSTDLCISGNPNWVEEERKIFEYVQKGVDLYNEYLTREYDYGQKLHTFENVLKMIKDRGCSINGFTIQKQSRDSDFKWHFDSSWSPLSHVLGLLYLNTLEPDEGGCTEFLNERKVRPEAGKLMISPANWTYAHNGNKVKADAKYYISFMVYIK